MFGTARGASFDPRFVCAQAFQSSLLNTLRSLSPNPFFRRAGAATIDHPVFERRTRHSHRDVPWVSVSARGHSRRLLRDVRGVRPGHRARFPGVFTARGGDVPAAAPRRGRGRLASGARAPAPPRESERDARLQFGVLGDVSPVRCAAAAASGLFAGGVRGMSPGDRLARRPGVRGRDPPSHRVS